MKRIGIDVGGTHTDAALVEGAAVVSTCKARTSADITSGILQALTAVTADIDPSTVDAVILGTTYFTNALAEQRGLGEVAAVRLGLPSGAAFPPKIDWPESLAAALGDQVYMLRGGHEFNGEPLAAVDDAELDGVIEKILSGPTRNVAVTSVFSPLIPSLEDEVAERLKRVDSRCRVVCSHQFGKLGLLERENAALLNASLLELADRFVDAIGDMLAELSINAPFFISQNDGTVLRAERVRDLPLLTYSSGPTNSMRGAAFLTGLDDAIVVDVGGTTSDFGMLVNGYPRESSWTVEIAGVRSNFRMPDIVAVSLGGGSIVADAGRLIGPKSVAADLPSEALCFGGGTLTATDIAVAAGKAKLGSTDVSAQITDEIVEASCQTMHDLIADGIERVKTQAVDMPLIVVGGGEFLVEDSYPGISRVLRPPDAAVANAIGAAFAQISGEAEDIFRPGSESRDDAIQRVQQRALDAAVAAGADRETVEIIDTAEQPIPYMADRSSSIRARAKGDIAL